MARKYEVYDERGRKIGEAREEPSTIEQAVGVFILLWLVWELLKAIIELVVLSIKIVIEYPRQALALFMIVALLVLFLFGIADIQSIEPSRQKFSLSKHRLLKQQKLSINAKHKLHHCLKRLWLS